LWGPAKTGITKSVVAAVPVPSMKEGFQLGVGKLHLMQTFLKIDIPEGLTKAALLLFHGYG
jgi:hypothetical protein